jgi:hypothetical protein
VGLEATIPLFEQAMKFHASDRQANVFGIIAQTNKRTNKQTNKQTNSMDFIPQGSDTER